MTEYSTHSIDDFIRETLTGDYRVGSDSVPLIRDAMESYVETVIQRGWEQVQADDRSTIQCTDIDVEQVPPKDSLQLAIAPTRRLSKEVLPENARMSSDAVLSMVSMLEEYGETIIQCAEKFMRHANRKTLRGSDVELYFDLFTGLPD